MSAGSTRPLSIFLCHSSADKSEIRKLYDRLCDDGSTPWLDEKNLLPGQDWHIEITKAVKVADVVIVCLYRKRRGRSAVELYVITRSAFCGCGSKKTEELKQVDLY